MNASFIKIKDRKLGDEWQSWQGNIESEVRDSASQKRLFLGCASLLILLIGGFLFFTLYMIQPRLEQFHSHLPVWIGLSMLATWCLLCLWFSLIVLSVWFEKDFFLHLGKREYAITKIVPWVMKFGHKLGVSKDRLGNSFVNVSNCLIQTTATRVQPEKLLILLPRCLKKPIIDTIIHYSKSMKIPTHIVSGGSLAREIILKLKPQAIIGVACERDLLSGIQDTITHIPVIGIPNKRPEGPCKDTTIDLKEMEKALQIFLQQPVHILISD